MKRQYTVLLSILTMLFLTTAAGAAGITVDPTTRFTFSADDFMDRESDEGIFLTSVPASHVADLCLGDRTLQAGDALSRDTLNGLTLQASCRTAQDAAIEYCTIADGQVSGSGVLSLSILPKKNSCPTALDSTLETYKNIPNTGVLKAEDPESDPLSYNLDKAPKRGTVELHEDGSFTYTPHRNKVGKDSFSFTVTDAAGNTSAPATVSVVILKPTDKAVYSDMDGDPDAFAAMWLKEEDLFSGSTVGGHLCFSPDEPLSRGDFLVMVMKLVEAEADQQVLETGFADEAATAPWLRPYLTTALRSGMISGISAEDGVVFQAEADLTKAEAVVMVQNILQLPVSRTQAVFSADSEPVIPVWAADAVSALSQAGVSMDFSEQGDPLTRRDAARLLYQVNGLLQHNAIPTFYWIQ